MLNSIRRSLHRAGLLEAAVLSTLFIIAGSIWIFAMIADEVVEGDSHEFDNRTLLALREADGVTPIGPPWAKQVARDLSALGSSAVISLVTLGTLGFLALRQKWASAVLVFASVAGGGIMSTVLKHAFERSRPDLALHLTEVSTLSFPSGHSMASAATYFTLGALLARTTADRRIKAYFLTLAASLALTIGLTRIYLGVHFPTDVLAGWCAGIAWALLCSLVGRWLQRKGAVEKERPVEAPAN